VKLLILGNAHRLGVAEEVERLLPLLCQHCQIVAIDLKQELDLSTLEPANLALVLGGDGAILRAARQMGSRQLPVLGVNLGRLGFLADLSPEELRDSFAQVLRGEFRITQHLMIDCLVETLSDGGDVLESRSCLALNEVVFHTVPPFPILELELQVDGEAVSHFSGDGLIVSTPIGSTAHSLSAGGPILAQDLEAFVLTPICPHTLTYRPVVESADRVYTVAMSGRSKEAVLIVDGQEMIPLTPQQRVRVRRATVVFQLVKVAGHSFYQTLRDKLRWGAPPNFRNEP
jgi:NAD+ kinase